MAPPLLSYMATIAKIPLAPDRSTVKKKMKADRILDARGWSCPWCCLKALSVLRRLKPGQVLDVLCTDPLTLKDLPCILEQTENHLLGVEKHPDFFRLHVLRGPMS